MTMNFVIWVIGIIVTILNIVYSVLTGENKVAPKILLIENITRNDFNNYTLNMTYKLTQEQQQYLNISCLSRLPSKWIWEKEESVTTPKWVAKERIFFNETTSTFASNLTIHLAYSKEPVDTNFSCSRCEGGRSRKDPFNQSVTCVEVNYNINDTELVNLRVFDGIPFGDCHIRSIEYTQNQCPTQNELSVDLQTLTSKCQRNLFTKRTDCLDLDSCETILSSSVRNHTCDLSISVINKKHKENSYEFSSKVIPRIFSCEARVDTTDPANGWSSYAAIYPSFSQNSSNNFSYYATVEEARHDKSIRLYALPHGVKFKGPSQLKYLSERTKFAKNESVEFLCVAIRYLYMKGFRWKLDDTYLMPGYHWDVNNSSDESVYIVSNNITMNGNFSKVTCDAPIWNSKKWKSTSLNVSLFSPIPPKSTIECKENGNLMECSCHYMGWPQPTITWWNESGLFQPNKSINGIRWGSRKQNESVPPHKMIWEENLSFHKGVILSDTDTGAVVRCKATNFIGEYTVNAMIPNSQKTKQIIIISITVITVCGIAAGLLVLMYLRYRKKLILYAKQNNLTIEEIQEFYSGASLFSAAHEALLLPYNPDYEISREILLMDGSILGSGQFGLVLKGSIGALTVAVKTIRPTADLIYFKSLLTELKILQFIGCHSNIVNLIGANTANINKREVFLVLDYCSNGNMLTVLRKCRERFINFFKSDVTEEKELPLYENSSDIVLTTGNLISFANEVANAMEHLEAKNVIHGDLAARNVLITDDLHAKVCDFGLSKQLLHYTVYVQKVETPLPLRWMAVESLQDMEFSIASDKWSYGVVLWEIFSLGEIPYPGEQWGFDSYRMLQEGHRMAMPKYANEAIYKLMLECWNSQPQSRPPYQHIINQLKKEEEKLT